MAGVEGEGKGKKRAREVRDEGLSFSPPLLPFRAPFGPFPPLLRPATQARLQAPVVQTLDNAIRRINHYPVDSVVCFVNIYPLDSDLSGG